MNAAVISAPLAITSGEPAGIGPDLCVQLAAAFPEIPFVVIADKSLLEQRAAQLGLACSVQDHVAGQASTGERNILSVVHVPLQADCQPGVLNRANSGYVLATLRRAVQGCQAGEFSGMVTAPVHKGIINDAGFPFTGHTEFLAELTATRQVVMMLVGGGMRRAGHGVAQHPVRDRTQRTRATDRPDASE
ncbi:MAG: 4-hydroxythreonine-4-phosphate dehydrogenase PdxA, partial [Gallionella sp.]